MLGSLLSCEKEITVDLPTVPSEVVVEASIYQDQPPIVMLTWSQGYFDPLDLNSLANMFVHDAIVVIKTNNLTDTLTELCTDNLTPEQLEAAAQGLGIPASSLQALHLCVYSSFSLVGVIGGEYTMTISKDNHRLTASTKINTPVPLYNLYFAAPSGNPLDSLGFIYGNIDDPDTLGNAYRWFAKRINRYPTWTPDADLRGTQKDFGYIAPFGSVADDSFFNGLNFEFNYYRGREVNSSKFDDQNSESGFFKRGDTVAVRGCSMDHRAFDFFFSMENQVANQGSPFGLPSNVKSNVSGGLGVFVGYGAVYDTVICQ